MATSTRKIEVDEATAVVLEQRAAENGVSVPELVAGLVKMTEPLEEYSAEDLAELDRRWAEIEAGAETVPHEKVVEWLKTWGTPAYKPWDDRDG
jgi:predicted transcriptional regulator